MGAEELTSSLALAAALLVYIEVRVVRSVERAVNELEAARGRRRGDEAEAEGPLPRV